MTRPRQDMMPGAIDIADELACRRLSINTARAWIGENRSIEQDYGIDSAKLVLEAVWRWRHDFANRYPSYRILFGSGDGVFRSSLGPGNKEQARCESVNGSEDWITQNEETTEQFECDRLALKDRALKHFGTQTFANSLYSFFAQTLEQFAEVSINRVLARWGSSAFNDARNRQVLKNWIKVYSRVSLDPEHVSTLSWIMRLQPDASDLPWVTQDVVLRAQLIQLLAKNQRITYISTHPLDPLMLDCVNTSGGAIRQIVAPLSILLSNRKRAVNKAYILQSGLLGSRITYAVRLPDQLLVVGVDPVGTASAGAAAMYACLYRAGISVSSKGICVGDECRELVARFVNP
jgi:hypothetical protein